MRIKAIVMKLKKCSKWLMGVFCIFLLAGCGKNEIVATVEPPMATEDDYRALIVEPESSGFSYRFDPTLNAEAMKDVIVDENAVYGFSPNPDSERLGTYAEYDWSDPEVVEAGRQDRIAYHESISTMYAMLDDMLAEGNDIETVARAISAERNRIRLASYDGDPEGLEKVKQSNLATYGDENGPTADSLFEKYGSWETVLTKAFSVNMGMDICLGLYDDYYNTYLRLGLIPDVFAELQNNNIPSKLADKYGAYRDDTYIIEADGYKAETCSYLSGQDMYILDNSGYIYTTLDGNIYYIGDGSVYMFCFVGNAENPLVGEFEDNGDIDPDYTELVGVKKYDEDSLLVTLVVINEDYFAALEEMCGYSEGSCEGILIKYLVSSDTYEIHTGEFYAQTNDGITKIGQSIIAYDNATMPELDGTILGAIRDSSRRTIKIIGDNGTADEVVYAFDVGKDVHASLQIGDDYQSEIYADAQYKNLYTGSKKLKKKVTLYIRK